MCETFHILFVMNKSYHDQALRSKAFECEFYNFILVLEKKPSTNQNLALNISSVLIGWFCSGEYGIHTQKSYDHQARCSKGVTWCKCDETFNEKIFGANHIYIVHMAWCNDNKKRYMELILFSLPIWHELIYFHVRCIFFNSCILKFINKHVL